MNAEELKAERERRELKQEEMAELLGSPVSSYRKWEQGIRKVPVWVPDKLLPKTIQFERLSIDEISQMDRLARAEGKTLDAFIAELLKEALSARRADQAPTSESHEKKKR